MTKAPARKTRAPKKPTVRVGPMAAKSIAIKGYGPEPEIGLDVSETGLAQALNWYSCVEEPDAHIPSFLAELKDRNYSKEDIAAAKRFASSKGFWQTSVLVISRMMQRQVILPTDTIERWKENVANIIATGNTIKEEKIAIAEEKGVVISIQERTDNKANEMFESFDDLAEEVWTGVKSLKDIKFFELFTTLEMKPAHARRLLERFKEEAQKYIDNPKDYSKETLKTMAPFWSGLAEACSTWATEKQAKPKTEAQLKKESLRKALTGAKKEAKAVSGLKYKPTDDESGLVSSNPAGIVGASMVVLYNTKYNVVTMLHAKGATGLSIKGTTITNVDEDMSKTKRAGRSTPVLKSMMSQTKTALKKSFDGIKGTELDLRTRTSDEIVIVRIIK